MPVYEYECEQHGRFEQLRPLAQSSSPSACPTCDVEAPRILSAPHLVGVPRSTMVAHERNERSRHEPRVQRCEGHAGKAQEGARPALKRYTGARPWVVEHG